VNLLQMINEELLRWEQQKELALAEWNKANSAIEALYFLTERMKLEVENENSKPNREKEEAASGT